MRPDTIADTTTATLTAGYGIADDVPAAADGFAFLPRNALLRPLSPAHGAPRPGAYRNGQGILPLDRRIFHQTEWRRSVTTAWRDPGAWTASQATQSPRYNTARPYRNTGSGARPVSSCILGA